MALHVNGERLGQTGRGKVLALRLMASAAIGTVTMAHMPAAHAQSAQQNYNIPAQPLASALNAFGRQSGLQVSLAAATSQGLTSRAVSGNLSQQAALAQLLAGTGISYSISNGTAVIGRAASAPVAASDGSTVLAPIVVQGQSTGQGGVGETVIGPEKLERINPTSVADVFREEAGIQVGSSLPMSQKVYVHGVEETNLAVSIDGSRQNNKVFHHNATNLIDPSILKAVDVDAGIAPADAGPGALAGAINYETRDAKDLLTDGKTFGGFVTSTYNFNSETVVTGLSAYGMKDGFDYLGYITYGNGNNFEGGNGDIVDGTGTNLISGLGKLGYEFDSGDRFEISYDRVLDDATRPYRANASVVLPAPPRLPDPATRNYRLDRQNMVLTYTDETPEGWWDPTVMVAYGSTKVTVPYFSSSVYQYDNIGKTSTLNGKFENKFSFDIGNVVAGFDFYNDRASLKDFRDGGRERASNIGIYAQARLEPWDNTRISFGGRADQQWFTGVNDSDFNNNGLSFNISGEYDLTEIFTAKAGFSHVWAGIPLAENFIINPGWNYGADGPEPVTANNYLVGLEAEHNGFTAEASLFRTDIDNARVPAYSYHPINNPAPFPGALPGVRSRNLTSTGFEIGAGYEWTSSYVKVKYAHIDVEVNGAPADSEIGNYLATPGGDIITLTAAHTFDQWNLTVGGDIELAPQYEVYKSYEVVNLFTEWKPEQLQNFTFRAEVKNLLDESYSDRASYGQEFGNVTPLYEPGRSFLITAKATF